MARGKTVTLTPEQKAAKTAERAKAKADNFVKLAPKRVTNALKQIKGIGALGNRNSYSYTDEQRDKIFTAVDDAVKAMKVKYQAGAVADADTFSF